VGATGLVGRHLLDALRESKLYARVVVVSRREVSREAGLDWVPFPTTTPDDLEAISRVLPEGHDFFSCLGTTRANAGSAEAFERIDYGYNYAFAKTAQTKGYSQYLLVSSTGADPRSMFLYPRVKGKLEVAIKSIPFWSTHIFRPGLLLGDRNENRFGERIAKPIFKTLDFISGGRLRNAKPVEAEAVAHAMMAAAQRTQGGTYTYEGAELVDLADAYYLDKP